MRISLRREPGRLFRRCLVPAALLLVGLTGRLAAAQVPAPPPPAPAATHTPITAPAAAQTAAATPEPAVDPQDAALFAWYDGLGLPGPADKPYVHVAGKHLAFFGFRNTSDLLPGFLLDETPTHIKLLVGWRVITLPKPRAATQAPPANQAVADSQLVFEPCNLADDLDAALKPPPTPGGEQPRVLGFQAMWTEADLYYFFLARVAALHGLNARSHALLLRAEKAADRSHLYGADEDDAKPPAPAGDAPPAPVPATNTAAPAPVVLDAAHAHLKKMLIGELPEELLGQALEDCNDPAFSRGDLAVPFAVVARQFPHSTMAPKAAEIAREFQIEIAEDLARAQQPPPVWAKMTRDEQIAELFYQMRDEYDYLTIHSHEYDSMDADRNPNRETTPAAKLLAMGWEVVPALIDHLDDRRPTRTVLRDCTRITLPYQSHLVRVADYAESMLYAITGYSADPSAQNGSYFSDCTDIAAKKKAAAAWWATVQAKGIDTVLAEEIATGDRLSSIAALRLLQRNPAKGLAAIVAAAPHAKTAELHTTLIDLAAKQKSPTVEPFLLGELKDASPAARLAAAECLWKRGVRDGLKIACTDMVEAAHTRPPENFESDTLNAAMLGEFLLSTGDPGSLDCLHRVLPTLTADDQYDILANGSMKGPTPTTPPSAADRNIDGFLVSILASGTSDAGDASGAGAGAWIGATCAAPFSGDVAGKELHNRGHRPGNFPDDAAWPVRLAARIELANRWRKEHGQPPLALPAEPPIPPADPTQVKALTADLAAATSAPAAQAALAKFDALGLSGEAPLSEALHALPADAPALAPGRVELARLASILRAVHWSPDTEALRPAERAELQALVGKPLDPNAFFNWIVARLKAPAGQLYLELDRPADGSGMVLYIGLTATSHQGQDDADLSTRFTLAGRELGGEGIGGEGVFPENPNVKEDSAALATICAAAPNQPARVTVDIRWRR
ncbi:MAG: hypothetical protein ACREJ2_03635 [Planctomycetota bacterium]